MPGRHGDRRREGLARRGGASPCGLILKPAGALLFSGLCGKLLTSRGRQGQKVAESAEKSQPPYSRGCIQKSQSRKKSQQQAANDLPVGTAGADCETSHASPLAATQTARLLAAQQRLEHRRDRAFNPARGAVRAAVPAIPKPSGWPKRWCSVTAVRATACTPARSVGTCKPVGPGAAATGNRLV